VALVSEAIRRAILNQILRLLGFHKPNRMELRIVEAQFIRITQIEMENHDHPQLPLHARPGHRLD